MEPLESTSIHLIQSTISRFLAVLPGGSADPAIVAEFNRQADFEFERIRDFLVLHYAANQRVGEPLWDRCREMTLPDSLNAKIEQFCATAYIHREHEELFTEVAWFQVLVGQGMIPRSWNPIADHPSPEELAGFLGAIEGACVETVRPMPLHIDCLTAFCGTANKEQAA
jgi:tryptophan halogenase